MTWTIISRGACAWVFALLVWPIEAQTPSDPSFRVSVNLVQVDAVVTDAKGNHVRNLEAADFQVLEDGRPKKITRFSWIGDDRRPVPEVSPVSPASQLRKEEVGRSIVLMFDDSGSHAEEDLLPVFPAVKRFVAEQLGPTDLAAVTASRGGMGFYQQFTNDKQQLLAAIDRLSHRPGFGIWTVDIPEVRNPDTGQLEPAFALRPGEPGIGYRDPNHPPDPIGYLMWALRGLQNTPGRKALILFAHSFAAPAPLIDMANRAGVVIYIIDPHGFDGVVPSTAPYRQLAKQTGGLFLRSAPGDAMVRDLANVLDDASSYYLIGYRPDRTDSGILQEHSVRHNIKVKVLRPGLEVRARNGYLGVPESETRSAPNSPAAQLMQAISSPFSAGRIRVRIEPRYTASAPDPKMKLRRPLLSVSLLVDGRDLKLTDEEGGRRKLAYSALVIVANQDGPPATQAARSFSFTLAPEQASQLAASGVAPSLDIQLPGPGPYQIRAAVRDDSSGEVGSAYQYLDVPDFDQPRIILSTIELSGSPDGWNDRATASTGYAPKSPLLFRCGVFGFRTSTQPPHSPEVEVQVVLFREDDRRPVSDTGPVPAPAASLADHNLTGQLNIATLPPGDYIMQLMVRDRLAVPKKQLAVQWTRFRVSPAR